MQINNHYQKIALGTVQFGLNYGVANTSGKIELKDAIEILEYSQEIGINTLDTAQVYGESESVLGTVGVKNYKIITKIPPLPQNCLHISKWLDQSLKKSLENLKLESVYAILLHNANDLLTTEGMLIYDTLNSFKKLGLVKKIGVSIYNPEQLEKIVALYDIDIIQTPLNVFDRRIVESGWIKELNRRKIEVHVRSIFLQGLLLMNNIKHSVYFRKWDNLFVKYEKSVKKENISKLEYCLRFIFSIPEIDKIVIGIDNIMQLKEIHEFIAKGPLTIDNSLSCNDLQLINPTNWNIN